MVKDKKRYLGGEVRSISGWSSLCREGTRVSRSALENNSLNRKNYNEGYRRKINITSKGTHLSKKQRDEIVPCAKMLLKTEIFSVLFINMSPAISTGLGR